MNDREALRRLADVAVASAAVTDGGWPCLFDLPADLGHAGMRFVFTFNRQVPKEV